MPTALLSVSDKSNIVDFAQQLLEQGFDLLSSGGTFTCLQNAGIPVTQVSAYTGFDEIMGGRVKTLHPKIHGGILGRRDRDQDVMQAHGIQSIDLVCINLYPFKKTIENPESTIAAAIENIDIGGPAMIRAAAKNHQWVTIVIDPADYAPVIANMSNNGSTTSLFKRQLAQKAFAHTAQYDARIQAYFAEQLKIDEHNTQDTLQLPTTFSILADKIEDLRYGENSHQQAAFYRYPDAQAGSIACAQLRQGKPMSYNNIADADAALACVRELAGIGCIIVKHANPCGAALGECTLTAYEKAFATDPTAAFGGIIAFNHSLDLATAQAILDRQFVEVIIAPSIADNALAFLSQKPNIRVLTTGEPHINRHQHTMSSLAIKSVSGGLIVQEDDTQRLTPSQDTFEVVTTRQPTAQELHDLYFAWTLVKYVKSNAIVFAKNKSSKGIGAGQMSRVFAAQIATQKAALEHISLEGTVVASDAFFPFRDGVDAVVAAGAQAIIQPGGSMRDAEVIAAANEAGLAMIFTNTRHFKH